MELVKIDPAYWDGYYQLALVLIKEGNNEMARSFIDTLLQKNPDYEKRAEAESLLAKLK